MRAIKVAFNTKLLKYQSERSAETFSVFLFLNRLELGFSIFYKNQYALTLALLEMFLKSILMMDIILMRKTLQIILKFIVLYSIPLRGVLENPFQIR